MGAVLSTVRGAWWSLSGPARFAVMLSAVLWSFMQRYEFSL